jgi:hypothetical protein
MSPRFNAQTKRLADLASTHRLPTMYEFRGFAAAGGIMSYGADISDIYRRAATPKRREKASAVENIPAMPYICL